MFKTLLIANRGEIACRIERTARRMGIKTVAVYSDVDFHALHVKGADESVCIGTAPATESYLNIEAILAAAKKTGAEAVHPGYGFLSENAAFAEACAQSGVLFVGAPAAAIRTMGLKDRAKSIMAKSGVPVVPGYLGEDQSVERLKREARDVGYPVLIKAVAGGGGRGMRRVASAEDFPEALEGARREAKGAFGDDRVLIEKYVSTPRHIEVQIFADSCGNVVHLFERDCSLQRRHQKVIEEALAPGLTGPVREAMCSAAVRAAKVVSYVGAGTVEFIADASEGLRADRFWFMEMNTRLQVEHPVTEAVTGIDLVEWQLRVAAGEPLPMKQDQIAVKGHATEARLYAEEPEKGFLPSVGRLERLRFPEDVRVDSGVQEGDEVTVYYDPLIAKVIAHAPTRKGALEKLARALAETEIAGVHTNNAFLLRVLKDSEFVSGGIDTGFLERNAESLASRQRPPEPILEAAARFILHEECRSGAEVDDPWSARDGFRHVGRAKPTLDFMVDGKRVSASPGSPDGGAPSVFRLASGLVAVIDEGVTWELQTYDAEAGAEASGVATDRILAPMPGKVTRVYVKEGQNVSRGQALAVLEAMKMEHTLSAPAALGIEAVAVAEGDQVGEGSLIIRFKQVDAT